jgi:hypothetical protein
MSNNGSAQCKEASIEGLISPKIGDQWWALVNMAGSIEGRKFLG